VPLTKLKILGFKSFKQAEINFAEGFNCIVGSNGSGKSNIIDALRWVFGETRLSQLRCREPIDLIFAGSKLDNPLGMAEVEATFSAPKNYASMLDFIKHKLSSILDEIPADFMERFYWLQSSSEVSFTRRIFRDGETEYLIAGVPVRQKDVKDLARALGLVFRSSCIIAQGEIEKLVELKPSDLRYYLVEACGLVEVQEKISECLAKLSSSTTRLEKLKDKIDTLTSQRASLKKQVDKYHKALKGREKLIEIVKEKLKRLEQSAQSSSQTIQVKLHELKNKKEVLSNELKALENQLAQVRLEMVSAQQEIEELKDLKTSEKLALEQDQLDLAELLTQKEKLLIEKGSLEAELRMLKENKERIFKTKKENEEKANSIRQEIASLNSCRKELEDKKSNLARELSAVEEEVSSLVLWQRELAHESEAIQQRLQDLSSRLKAFDQTVKKLFEEVSSLTNLEVLCLQYLFPAFKGIRLIEDLDDSEEQIQPDVIYLKGAGQNLTTSFLNFLKIITEAQDKKFLFINSEGVICSPYFCYKPTIDNENIFSLARKLDEEQAKLSEIEGSLDKVSHLISQNQTVKNKLEVQLKKLDEELLQIAVKQSLLERVCLELDKSSIDQELEHVQQLTTSLTSKLASVDDEIIKLDTVIERIRQKDESASIVSDQYLSKVNQLDLMQQRSNELASAILKLREDISKLDIEHEYLSDNLEKIDHDLQTQKALLLAQTSLAIDDLRKESSGEFENLDDSELDKLFSCYVRESLFVQYFGSTNLEEFERVDSELKTLVEERDDIHESMAKIENECHKLRQEFESKLDDFVDRSSKRFSSYLGLLFEDAKGQVWLSETKNEAYIAARLGVKKELGLQKLSGGEKTLVSLAFLFALAIEGKNTVLLLDEVDAPLDDFNTGRFLELVQKLSEDTQILSVTHNKLSMLRSDNLIGVSVDSRGTSQVVELSLNDLPVEAVG
jgi:chromosome segregation protein